MQIFELFRVGGAVPLKLKFNLYLSNFCHQKFQNIVTWGVELQLRNTIFACIPMDS